jgi:hypothetical protein
LTTRPDIVVSVTGKLTAGETESSAFLAAPKSQLVVMRNSPIAHTARDRNERKSKIEGGAIMGFRVLLQINTDSERDVGEELE